MGSCVNMNYIIYLRLTFLKGFFWGDKFISYGRRWGGKGRRAGWGLFQRKLALRLTDGCFSSPKLNKKKYTYAMAQNMGLGLLAYNLAMLPKTRPWAWAAIQQLKIRSYRGSRYKLGLPANGQRTHTNANTTGRVSDEASKFIRQKRVVLKIWEARKTTRYVPKSIKRKTAGSKTKNLTKGGKVVRSKKKVDVWK